MAILRTTDSASDNKRIELPFDKAVTDLAVWTAGIVVIRENNVWHDAVGGLNRLIPINPLLASKATLPCKKNRPYREPALRPSRRLSGSAGQEIRDERVARGIMLISFAKAGVSRALLPRRHGFSHS
jgi:hypothetical protein